MQQQKVTFASSTKAVKTIFTRLIALSRSSRLRRCGDHFCTRQKLHNTASQPTRNLVRQSGHLGLAANRGAYAKGYREGTNVVLLAPDLHKLFPDSEAVNRALRDYVASKRTA